MIGDEDKEKVRQSTDFVQLVAETVELRQRGQEFWGCCPFHGEKSPSFKVNPNTGLWHCFGCGEGGDVFSYVQKRENLEFPDAIRYLADRAGIELVEERGRSRGPKRNRLIECLAEAQSFYATMLMRGRGEGPDSARAYFSSRGFGGDVCRRWGLGFAPGRGALVRHLREKGFSPAEMMAADLALDRNGRPSDRFYNRVMFPINDEMGRPIAFGGRVIGPKKDTAKYVNTRDTSVFNKGKHLFAYDRAKETMAATGEAVVCEGYTDVISMHENGLTNAVAALGTAFRLDHIKLMERQRVNRIICMFDGDAAGQRAAERAVQFIDKTTAELRCVVLPGGQDPMEFLAQHDASELRSILDEARPLMDFVFDKRLFGVDLGVPGQRVAALGEMARVLAPLKRSVVMPEYAERLAATLAMDVEDVKEAIRQAPESSGDDSAQRGRSSWNRAAGRGPAMLPRSNPRFAESQARAVGADLSARTGSYGDEVPVEAYDYLPSEAHDEGYAPAERLAYGSAPSYIPQLSEADRRQLEAEGELLCALAAKPETARSYAERLADVSWADSRNEAMAWAMLSTPAGASPAEVVAAAAAVEPEAPRILSAGRVMSEEGMCDYQKLDLVVDTLEELSCARRVAAIRAKMATAPDEEQNALLAEATRLQARANELRIHLSSSVS
ncbi:DNA primase [Paratractidigestivibacter sp.]|uniref:DNA primase n=1 Tax=Paratractidigestivibacter sp. TaxID=2847316 RepID=UPI002AC9D483|nr:DNA primase [Paratractidigestivibacter sp.]